MPASLNLDGIRELTNPQEKWVEPDGIYARIDAAISRAARIITDYTDRNAGNAYCADLEATLSDVLADLRHLATRAGINYYMADARASRNYNAELAEKAEDE